MSTTYHLVGLKKCRGTKIVRVYRGDNGECLVIRTQRNNDAAWSPDLSPAQFMEYNEIPAVPQ